MSWNRSTSPRARLRHAAQYHIEGLERRLLLSSAIAAFGTQQTFSTGPSSNPRSVAAADVNSDGKFDLLVANSVSNTAGIFLGNGNGTFQNQQTFTVANNPFSIAVADVNGDGKLDLLTANNNAGNVSLLLGNGNGTFQAQKTFGAGVNPRFVAVADVNGDGKPDLLVANYNSAGSGSVSVLLGNGNGTFQGQQVFAAGTKPSSIAVADFNVDGKLDLAVANKGSNNVSILLGNGNGTFAGQQVFTVGSAPFSVAAGDLNQDGKIDLAVADESTSAVSVLLGNGNGTFQTHQTYATGSVPCAVAISDINGDGKPDLALTNYSSNNVSVLLGNGNGSFQPQKTFATGTSPINLAIADVNRDGRQDLLIGNEGSNSIGELLGDVPPTVLSINRGSPPGPITSDNSVTYAVTFNEPVAGVDPTDFTLVPNGVTATTPVVVSGSGAVYTVTINGMSGTGTLGLNLIDDGGVKDAAGNPLQPSRPSFKLQQTFATSAIGLPVIGSPEMVASDINKDGKPDLIVAGAGSSTVSILLGNGNGTFQPQRTFATGSRPLSVAVADLNGDGRLDLVVANDTRIGTVSILLGNGDGTFQAQQTFAVGSYPSSLAVADVDGDGTPDLLVSNAGSGTVGVLLGNGNGTFHSQQTFATGFAPVCVAAADVNGDGKLNLLVADLNSNAVSVLLGNGNGTFQTQHTFDAGSTPYSVAVADVNGDGRSDLVVGNSNTGTVGILLGNGNGTFQEPQTFATGANPQSVTVSDVNGDGKPDIGIANGGNNTIGILLGNGDGTFQLQQTFAVGSSPVAAAFLDVNGDGSEDLIAANMLSGNVSVLLANSNGDLTGQAYTIVPLLDTITGTSGIDQITLTQDSDHTHVDWTLGTTTAQLLVTDPSGLTINGNGGSDTINLIYGSGGTNNPLPNTIHLNGTFTINGLQGSNPLANTNLEIGRSTVYVSYSSSDPKSLIKGYLLNGYNNGAWNGTPTALTGVITSSPAASNALQTTAIGYADSADGLISGQPANTIELKYTLYGDTRLLATVGSNDFTTLTLHYHQTNGGTWDTGDFNYDGSVNFSDFTLLTRTYNTSLGSQAAPGVQSASITTNPITSTVANSSSQTPDLQPAAHPHKPVPVHRKKHRR